MAGAAYNFCVSVVGAASQQGQMIHNGEFHTVGTEAINTDCEPDESRVRNCWVTLNLAKDSGLVISGCIRKHPDELVQELVVNTEDKTPFTHLQTDRCEGYVRQVLVALPTLGMNLCFLLTKALSDMRFNME